MNLIKVTSLLIFSLMSFCVHAEDLESWSLPDPSDLIAGSNILCLDQSKSALAAALYRDMGVAQEKVNQLIPEGPKSLSLRLISVMRENIEDAYKYPNISKYSLYSFRSEVCMREVLEAKRLPRFSMAYPSIVMCQKKYGSEKSNDLFLCIKSSIGKIVQ